MRLISIEALEAFFVIFVRISGFFVLSPIFGRRNIPNTVKASLILIMSYLSFLSLGYDFYQQLDSNYYILIIIVELIIGIILGYITFLVFSVFYIAGQIIDMKIGFGVVNILDPNYNLQVPIVGAFYYNIAFLLFFTINGHHQLIRFINSSFQVLTPGQWGIGPLLIPNILSIFSDVFVLSYRIALPIIGVILITDIILGILSKSVPQINVFVVGMPIKIIIGLFVIIATLPMLAKVTEMIATNTNTYLINTLKSFTGS